MSGAPSAALRARLETDVEAKMVSLRTGTDQALAIGRDVWRLRWRGQQTTAVASDAGLPTTCGAVLDALALRELALGSGRTAGPAFDLAGVNVLVDRPLPGAVPSETDQALRSMRDAARATARIWYGRDGGGWVEDLAPAPTWPEGDARVQGWLRDLLLPRLTTPPGPLALALIRAVDDPSLHLYPSAINARSTDVWALRLDGLQIGTASALTAVLTIGKPGASGDGPQRKLFTDVFGQPSVTVSVAADTPIGHLSVVDAAEGIRVLLRRFRGADVRGAPITHRLSGGLAFVDEHTLEARLLKGLTHLADDDQGLVLDDDVVARGSQFPTQWGHGADARYLDALLCRGRTPLAVELKVATGGQGRYYRRSLVQAVLYRHFIRNAPGLDPWFRAAGLDRMATEASIGIPIPARWTQRFARDRALLDRIAGCVGAQVHVLDDRATPERAASASGDEPSAERREMLTWRLAAELSSRWPTSLGRVVEHHPLGGFYDQIQLQAIADRSLSYPSAGPRVSLNRPGSLRVLSQTGSERWVWRGICDELAHGLDAGEAAVTVGAIAGLGKPQSAAAPCFAAMAYAFLQTVGEGDWSWRCAWPDDDEVAPWVERYRIPLRRYSRVSAGDALPTIARIWGAVRLGEAAVIIDQVNLRTWVWSNATATEVTDADPFERVAAVAGLALI